MDAALDEPRVDVRGGVTLVGLHPLKHCLRFGGEVLRARTSDRAAVLELARVVCPDLVELLDAMLEDVAPKDLLGDGRPTSALPSPVVAVARRPTWTLDDLAGRLDRPVVVLERPTHLGNLGAAVRVAAAADAAGLVSAAGTVDPWHARAVRGSAGLHWALPVLAADDIGSALDLAGRIVIAVDPEGDPDLEVPPGAVLVFGSEREGLTAEARARADAMLALPMRAGVSSLNLATSVAATLYRHCPPHG